MRQELIVDDSQHVEADESDPEVLQEVVPRRAKDLAYLNDTIKRSNPVVVDVSV